MIDENNECKCDGCIHVEQFRSITKSYDGIGNDATETVVDNDERTVEVKLKPQQFVSKYAFPNRGNKAVLYMDTTENRSYRWDEVTGAYICIGSDYNQIKIINGGNANG